MRRTLDLLDSLPPPFQPTARRMSWPEPLSDDDARAPRKETKCCGQRCDILVAGKEPTWGVERGICSPERAGSSRIIVELAGQKRPGLRSARRFFGGCGPM